MVILLLILIPDVIVPAVESDVRMICDLLCAYMEPRSINHDDRYVP